MTSRSAFSDDVWELYDTNKDWSQAHDLSKAMPEKLHELQRLWIIEATRNGVLPMDDRTAERFNSDIAGRPVLISGNSQVLANGMGGLNENGIVNVKNKSHSVTAQLNIPLGITPNGAILSQGGICGGWMFYVKDGTLTYLYNFVGLNQFVIEATQPLTAGQHQVRMEAGSQKAATSHFTLMGRPSGRVASSRPPRWSSLPTKRLMSA